MGLAASPRRSLVRSLGLLVVAVLASSTLASSAEAVPPGQNGAIVFEAPGEAGNQDVYLMGPNGEDPGPLGVNGRTPVPHPSGKAVAVHSNNSSARRLYDLEGNLIRGLATEPIFDFSPDGRFAVTRQSYRDTTPDSAILDLETNLVTPLGIREEDFGESMGTPRFTPDGEKIVYSFGDSPSFGVHRSRIFIVNKDGSGKIPLFEAVTSFNSVSPDGTKIAFINNEDDGNIWSMGIDGSGASPITNAEPGFSYWSPEFSPDGTKIVANRNFYEFGGANYSEIVVMDIAGGGERTILDEAQVDGLQNFVPALATGAEHPRPQARSTPGRRRRQRLRRRHATQGRQPVSG